jgi:hypothetical protein
MYRREHKRDNAKFEGVCPAFLFLYQAITGKTYFVCTRPESALFLI